VTQKVTIMGITEYILIALFTAVMGGILLKGLSERVLFRLSVRNIIRRKGSSVIVVAGLMIGTAIISSSLVIGDTMDAMVESEVLDEFGLIDEIVVAEDASGEAQYFDQAVYADVESGLMGMDEVDGITPAVVDTISLFDVNQQLFEPSMTMYGLDFASLDGFGGLEGESGVKYSTLSTGDPDAGVPGEALMGAESADDLDAKAGDTVQVFFQGQEWNFVLADVLEEKGMASRGTGIYVALPAAQMIVGEEGRINSIFISNDGGDREGMAHTDDVVDRVDSLELTTDDGNVITVGTTKEEVMDEEMENVGFFTDLFFVFGTFTIIAGAMLIVNIFVMLGEERKSEMGIQRAVGMRRDHLTRGFVYEGSLYSALSAALGTLVGVIIGYVVIFAMESFAAGGSEWSWSVLPHFSFTMESMVIAFTAGFLLTVATITLVSTRISRLNIVRAIRGLAEPPKGARDGSTAVPMAFLGLLGLAGVVWSFVILNQSLFYAAAALAVFGGGMALRWWISSRVSMTLTGAVMVILSLIPWSWFPGWTSGMEIFILSGVIMVGGAMMVVLANSEALVGAFNRLRTPGGRSSRSGGQAVSKVAMAYPNSSKFRTGMTMGMFALIIFTITVMSTMTGIMNANIDAQVDDLSGGYDIFGYSAETGVSEDMFDNVVVSVGGPVMLSTAGPVDYENLTTRGGSGQDGEPQFSTKPLFGFPDDFLEDGDFELDEWDSAYGSAGDVWDAVCDDPGVVIVDTQQLEGHGPEEEYVGVLDLGSTVTMMSADGQPVEKKVIGVLKTTMFGGIITSEENARRDFNFTTSTLVLFDVAGGVDPDEVGKDLERAFLAYGLQTFVLQTIVEEQMSTMNQFFNLFKAYLGLGLIVGLAGLGIITLRAVRERRQQIGMLRAIGFTRGMVRRTFLMEALFICLMGILIGMLLGVTLGWQIWYYEFRAEGMEIFAIPYMDMLVVGGIALLATAACTIPTANQAAKVTPAEALRFA
jgi:putative ABC transport system permease protein